MKKFFIYSNGCYKVDLQAEKIRAILINNGYKESFPEEATDIILFTCSNIEPHFYEALTILNNLISLNNKARYIIAGCMPLTDKELLRVKAERLLLNYLQADIFQADLIPMFFDIKYNNYDLLLNSGNTLLKNKHIFKRKNCLQIQRYLSIGIIKTIELYLSNIIDSIFYRYLPDISINEKSIQNAFITIQHGCVEHCTFCSMYRFFRGCKSKSSADIVKELKTNIKKGKNKIYFLGHNTSDYGKERGESLIDLLNIVMGMKEEFSLYILDIHPSLFEQLDINDTERFNKIFVDKRLRGLDIHLESGSQRILKLMNRRMDIDKTIHFINKIKKLNAGCSISITMLTGFPNEKIHDFLESLNIIKKINFDSLRVYYYSNRNNPGECIKNQKIFPVKLFRKFIMYIYGLFLLKIKKLKSIISKF